MSASELYDLMKEAITKEDSESVRSLTNNPTYEANRRGGSDQRTNLHTAVMIQSLIILTMLLGQNNIDPNILTSKGFSPLMLACECLRIDALKILLEVGDRGDRIFMFFSCIIL